MIEMVVVVCLATAPEQCKDVHLTFSEPYLTPMRCVMTGQPEIARWINSQTQNWTVKKWHCGPAGRHGKDI